MALEYRYSHGKRLPWLYGRYWIGGRSHVVNTRIRWRGAAPRSFRDTGDAAFEAARAEARTILRQIAAQAHAAAKEGAARTAGIAPPGQMAGAEADQANPGQPGRPACRPPRAPAPASWPVRTEGPAVPCGLDAMVAAVDARPSRSEGWRAWRRGVVASFVAWAYRRGTFSPGDVDRLAAEEYMAVIALPDEWGRTRTARTLRTMRNLIGAALARLLPQGAPNPFHAVPVVSRPGDRPVGRRPLSAREVAAVLRVASETDPAMHDLILAALSTGLRRGDVCRLRWDAVDFRGRALRLSASKTGAPLELPILPAFREMLRRLRAARDPGLAYVFPEAERLLRENPDAITRRVKKILVVALAGPDALAGCAKNALRKFTCQPKAVGRRAASTLDFHALRTTFVTLAINGGIPVDKLRALTGHRTVDMILRHYYKPQAKDLEHDLAKALPPVLSSQPPNLTSQPPNPSPKHPAIHTRPLSCDRDM